MKAGAASGARERGLLLQTTPPSLQVSVLNGLAFAVGGIQPGIRSRKARALLAFVALSGARSVSRERLVGLFWADSDEERARASLRQCVKEVRDALQPSGCKCFDVGRNEVRLENQELQIDLSGILARLDQGDLPSELLEIPRLYEAILAGYDDISPDFHVWLVGYRQSIQERLTRGLRRLAESNSAGILVMNAWQALLNLDPTNELAARNLITSMASKGDTASALKIYNRLWKVLEDEHDIEPSQETRNLIARIKLGEFEALPASSPAHAIHSAPATEQIIAAVTPQQRVRIEVAAIDSPKLPKLSAGLVKSFRHELLACLVRFREWSIIDGSIQATSPDGQPPETASSDFTIDMSVYAFNDETYFLMTLQDLHNRSIVWSERYVLSVGSWFDVQREIVRRIAVVLRLNISAEVLRVRLPKRPREASLHNLWMEGQALFSGYSHDRWTAAEATFRRIIEQDPQYSPAYSSLAQLRNSRHLAAPGLWRNPVTAAEALDFSAKAAQADPLDSRAHLCLAWSYAMSGRYELALPYYHSAVSLNENDPWTLVSACQGLAFQDKNDEALALEHHLFKVVPTLTNTQWAYLVGTRFHRGDLQGAVEAASYASAQISNIPGWAAASLALQDRLSEANEEWKRFLALNRLQWQGPLPDDLTITHWFLHNFPIRYRRSWERLRDGIARAGAPFIEHRDRRPTYIGADGPDPLSEGDQDGSLLL